MNALDLPLKESALPSVPMPYSSMDSNEITVKINISPDQVHSLKKLEI